MWKCRTFGNWENIAFGLGLFTLTEMAKNNMNGKKVQMVRWVCWSPLSPTDPNNIGQTRKITYYV